MKILMLFFSIVLISPAWASYDDFITEQNYDPFIEAFWLTMDFDLVVMNENQEKLVLALCQKQKGEENAQTEVSFACPVIYYGPYSELCENRKVQRHIETGVKALAISGAMAASGVGPLLVSKAGSLATPIQYAMTAQSVVRQGMDHYEIWQQTCLQEESEEDEDSIIKALWETRKTPSLKPIEYNEEDKHLFLGRLLSVSHPFGPPNTGNSRRYLFKSTKDGASSYLPVLHSRDFIRSSEDVD